MNLNIRTIVQVIEWESRRENSTCLFVSSLDQAISDDDDDISVDEMYVTIGRILMKKFFLIVIRKNTEAFDKETRNDNIDITDVDANADLFGKWRDNTYENDLWSF